MCKSYILPGETCFAYTNGVCKVWQGLLENWQKFCQCAFGITFNHWRWPKKRLGQSQNPHFSSRLVRLANFEGKVAGSGKMGKWYWEQWEFFLSQIVPFFSDFSPVFYQLHTFFYRFPTRYFWQFPPISPILPPFFSFSPFSFTFVASWLIRLRLTPDACTLDPKIGITAIAQSIQTTWGTCV